VQPILSSGMVHAPARDWSELVIEEASGFPKGKHDDLTDLMIMALKYRRDGGLAKSDEEVEAEVVQKSHV
jgi:phage terminase large subunit-like protein